MAKARSSEKATTPKTTKRTRPASWSAEFIGALTADFPVEAVEWVVVATNKKPPGSPDLRECWAPYVKTDAIRARLDEAAGPDNWSTDVAVASPTEMICRLTVKGITRADVGDGQGSEQVLKAAATDALKRAAVQFGIGAYLRRLGRHWLPKGQGPPKLEQLLHQAASRQRQEAKKPPGKEEAVREAAKAEPAAAATPWSELSDAQVKVYIKDGREGFVRFAHDNGLSMTNVLDVLNIERSGPEAAEIKSGWQRYIDQVKTERRTTEDGAYRWALQVLLARLRRGAAAPADKEADDGRDTAEPDAEGPDRDNDGSPP